MVKYFIHKPNKSWVATEVVSGLEITPTMEIYKTKKECESKVLEIFNSVKIKFSELIKYAIKEQIQQGIRDKETQEFIS